MLESSWAWRTSLDTSLYAWWFPYVWNQTAHLESTSCQPGTSDANSSFNASSDLFKVEGLSPLHKLLRSVISALSMFDRLVLKQTLQSAKCHWVKQCSERNCKHLFFFTETHDVKIHSYSRKVIMWLWNHLPLVGILLQNFLSSEKEVWFPLVYYGLVLSVLQSHHEYGKGIRLFCLCINNWIINKKEKSIFSRVSRVRAMVKLKLSKMS